MAVSTSLLSSSSYHSNVLSFNPFSVTTQNRTRTRTRTGSAKIFASSRREGAHDHHDQYYKSYRSRLVDENMIVLRKRVHEMKMVERNYEPPADWMDWEKKYYTTYDSFICHVMGLLQSHLMNTRPTLALATMALIMLSVPTSAFMIFFHFMDLTKELLIT